MIIAPLVAPQGQWEDIRLCGEVMPQPFGSGVGGSSFEGVLPLSGRLLSGCPGRTHEPGGISIGCVGSPPGAIGGITCPPLGR
jgi:hypothetical protein